MRFVICDDKEIIMNGLKKAIQEIYGNTAEIMTTKMPDCLLKDWIEHPNRVPDVLIMDIEFPYLEYNGIEIAKDIQNTFSNIKLIFITGKINYAQDIFTTQPCAFLVKPVDIKRLKEALLKVEKIIAKEKEEMLFFKAHGSLIKIPSSTVIYVESVGHNIIVHSEERNDSFRMKLTDCLGMLSADFWLIHQSYIVHSRYISKMTKEGIELKNSILLPVSRSKYREIKEKFFDEMEKKE